MDKKRIMKSKYHSKFSSMQIQQMRSLVDEGRAVLYVARKFNCRPNSVLHHVFDLITPRKVSKKMQQRYLKSSNLTISQVKEIRQLSLKKGMSATELGKRYNISQTAALAIVNGKTFRWIPGQAKCGEIVPIEYNFRPKTDLIRGPKKGSKKRVKSGVLVKYAERHHVKPTTICRWVKMGKLKLKKNEMV